MSSVTNMDLRIKLGLLNPEQMQEKLDRDNARAFELLELIKDNEKVDRWDLFRVKGDVSRIIQHSTRYDDVKEKAFELIESAKSSL